MQTIEKNEVERIADVFPDLREAARICGITAKAIEKWIKLKRMPYTELTGTTNYSQRLANADSRLDRDKLIETARRPERQAKPTAAEARS